MRAVWAGSDGIHLPFDNVLYVRVSPYPEIEGATLPPAIDVFLIDGKTRLHFKHGAEEFIEQWYAWLQSGEEDNPVITYTTPSWTHESMRQAQEERRNSFHADASLRRQIRQMQGGVDVT